MVEEIKANDGTIQRLRDVNEENLPEQQEFVDYMREQTSVKELFEKTGITKTTIEHWFRRDKAGFSHPSVEDWEKIKPHLKEIKYDKELTTLHSIEWKQDPKSMWPTPTTKGFGHASGGSDDDHAKESRSRGTDGGRSTSDDERHNTTSTTNETMDVANTESFRSRETRYSDQEERSETAVQHNLTAAVEMWPTPTANEARTMQETNRQDAEDVGQSSEGQRHRWWDFEPNVGRVAHGVPGGYTDLKDWEILSSRKSSKKSAKR